ncbi:FtsX-like permease family protein [Streptomyces sp. NPDC053493]|uniref:FtsX-like permease family protein n=1 Tax=Streptomyces sp. NPDC053493 TaxID=3365705 RepID=UPI0037CEDA5D
MSRRTAGALGRVVRAGVGRRRVQTTVMVLTTLLSVAAGVLAVGLLVVSQAPFDRAFARQNGAHLTAEFDGRSVTAEQAAATARADGVTEAAGPFPVTSVRLYRTDGGMPGPGFEPPPLTVVGRADPATSADRVDRVELTEGRWAGAPGEIVVERASVLPGTRTGSVLTTARGAGGTRLTVVGFAKSVGESGDAWTTPAQLTDLTTRTALAGDRPAGPDLQMLYRFDRAATAADIDAGRSAVTAAAASATASASRPASASVSASPSAAPHGPAGTRSYLDVRQAAQQNTAAYIPFVTAFAVLGLALSVLVIAVVVSGAVSTAIPRIGVLKALGFTPSQVGRAFVAQALIPATAGGALGAVLANALAVPLMAQVAEAYGTASVRIPLWVDLAVPAGALLVVAAAALGPALRAARLRTADAVRAGGAGGAGGTARTPLHRVGAALGRLRLPPAVVLGLTSPLARPGRSAATGAAVAFGALAVTFAVGLGSTLIAVQTDGDPDRGGDVTVRTVLLPEGIDGPDAEPGPPADPAAVAAALRAVPGAAAYHRTATAQVGVAGLKGGAQLVVYEGDTADARHTMTSGRWFRAPGEAVAPTNFLRATGKAVGDTITLSEQGRTVRLTLVGEIFDLGGHGMTLRTDAASAAALRARHLPSTFQVRLAEPTDADDYLARLNARLTPLGARAAVTDTGTSGVIRAMQVLTGMLTLMFVAVAGLGVLNTVVLDTRDRVRDLGVLKSLGMTPGQTVTHVLVSVGLVGLLAGAVGVPLGVALHRAVMPATGRAVGTTIPPADLDVYGAPLLAGLALAGVLIATAGALLPAGWAARTDTARALRTE